MTDTTDTYRELRPDEYTGGVGDHDPFTGEYFEDKFGDALEDFDSPDLTAHDAGAVDHGYLDSMWKGHSFKQHSLAEDLVIAHGMVESFVNSFARDGHYRVTFNEDIKTAGTDMRERHVMITPAPVADTKLSVEQVGRVLTGLAVHEVSHTRYGRATFEAVQRVWPTNSVAHRVSNVLDDIRIERRFVADYPGFEGIFEPTLDYVGSAGLKDGELVPTSVSEPTNLLISATRYPKHAAWTDETRAAAAWWTAWADRWSREDAPKRHVEAVREALQHIADQRAEQLEKRQADERPQPAPKSDEQPGQGGGSEAPETPEAPAGGGSEEDGETPITMTDQELDAATRNADAESRQKGRLLPDDSGSKAVDRAALREGAERQDIADLKEEADEIIENARNIEDDGHGASVDVARSMRGLASKTLHASPSSQAARYIANAILRSRTGNQTVAPFRKHGRLDNGGLQRLALGDARIFEKRSAPSPGKYLIWLMIDCSSSMTSSINQAAQVAHAVASASLSVPSARVAVWGWTDPFRASTADAGVVKVWETGGDTKDIFRMAGLRLRGTPDSIVMGWAGRAIRRAARPDEQPVVVFVSDGQGYGNMDERVAEARDAGVRVYSVSFGHGFGAASQEKRFGKKNFVPFAGSVIKTARPLADLFARITSGR